MCPAGFGVRSAVGEPLSDVVAATSFEELDAGLDGCVVQISTADDVRLNVRLGPGRDFPHIATIAADEIETFVGISASGVWYRIEFRGGWGWVLSTSATVDPACNGLRRFPDSHGPEDVTRFLYLGEQIDPEQLPATASEPRDEKAISGD